MRVCRGRGGRAGLLLLAYLLCPLWKLSLSSLDDGGVEPVLLADACLSLPPPLICCFILTVRLLIIVFLWRKEIG